MNKNKLVQQQQQQQQQKKKNPLNERKRNFDAGNESQKVTRNMVGEFISFERKAYKNKNRELYDKLQREKGVFVFQDLLKHRQSKNLELMVNKISEINQRKKRGIGNETIPGIQLQVQRPTKELCDQKGKKKLYKMNSLLSTIAKTYK
ncbi:hypothetical protein M0813_29251 [Anaeramoeba flamelloides]|uniref:Uncharacterized protein n=1 Tax=Anaeramoeba flamelloides TaxID=1746091 RepID=A0AAV7Y4Y9_9EUKA|nr:hypothetical protein M0812_30125 [Anaeramoeba flamelloides]KAJ6234658.1 hypothetical protein M0813_29251 [Anaeramoeba flamelloides]